MTVVMFIGVALIVIGGICDILGAIGLLRFPNFFARLHAATVGTIGGAVVPLVGVGLFALGMPSLDMSYRIAISAVAFATAFFILLVSPTGTHAIARAAHRAKEPKPYPVVCDHLKEDVGNGDR